MIIRLIDIFCLYLLVIQVQYGKSERIKDKMYESINGYKACFRRMNATHQIGCSSKRGGSSGVIHYCEQQQDLDFILKNGTAGPYIPLIPTTLFTKNNLLRLKINEKISGLLLYVNNNDKVEHFTHDQTCPNNKFNIDGSCGGGGGNDSPIWNPYGSGLIYENIPFPIFYIEDKMNIDFAKNCFEKFNNFSYDKQRDRSLCSLQLSSFMYGTTDTPTCIRRSNSVTNLNPRRFCDPLADQNIWATILPPIKKYKYIIITARLDTTTMFDKTSGAITPITGLVTLLSTAQLIKKIFSTNNDLEKFNKNILFICFNGESYDYIGSQRLLFDMNEKHFPLQSDVIPPITLDDIELFIEFSQLGNYNGTVVGHYYKQSQQHDQKQQSSDDSTGAPRSGDLNKFLNILQANKGDVLFDESPNSLPPASLHTFLKSDKSIPGLILSDHKREYYNKFYNSIYDNVSNIDYQYMNLTNNDDDNLNGGGGGIVEPQSRNNIQKYVGNISEMVAKSVYFYITGQKVDIKADLQLIDELFHCYLENASCKVHHAVQKMKIPDSTPFNLYVGVGLVSNFITNFVGMTLAWVTGTVVEESSPNCTNYGLKEVGWKYYNMSASLDDLNKTMCFKASMNFTEAMSPAFKIKDYDWSSDLYSSWTESTWGDFRIRIFLKPSAAHENMTIAIGSIVFVLSMIFVYFVKSRSDVLFAPQLPTLAPTNC